MCYARAMKAFWRFLRFAGTFLVIIGMALSFFWVAGGAGLTAIALKAVPW